MQKVENLLLADYRQLRDADVTERTDKGYTTKFKLDMMHSLKHEISFDYAFDSLGRFVKIIKSPDAKVRVFSWDELSGGRWHDMSAIVQYVADGQNGVTKMLTYVFNMNNSWDCGDYNDRMFTKVYNYTANSRTNYLLVGWGSHGGLSQYVTLEVYTIEAGAFVPIKGAFSSGTVSSDLLTIECMRTDQPAISFTSGNTISYKEFYEDPQKAGSYLSTGKTVNWKLDGSVFKKQ